MLRIAVGSFVHEANTFTAHRGTWDEIAARCATGDAVITQAAQFDTAIPGFLTHGDREGVAWRGLWSGGLPGGAGMLRADAFERVRAALLEAIERAGPLDGCLLSLAGGSVVDAPGMEDGDGLLLEAVRGALPPGCRLGVALDMHANVTERMVAAADVIVAFQTFPPHWDKVQTGALAAALVAGARRGEIDPVMALARPPMLLQPERQDTRRSPMRDLLALAREHAARPGMLAVSLLPGFGWSDVPAAGASVLAIADGDGAGARSVAAELAERWFERREQFAFPLVAIRDAVERAVAGAPGAPVLLCDHADNVGAGGAGDSTQLLAALLAGGARDAAYAVLCDPAAVARCVAAGAGARVELTLGGRRDPAHSAPLEVSGTVERISDGAYRNAGPLWPGAAGSLGRAVALRLDGVQVIVSERPNGAFDPGVFTTLGIDPFAQRSLVVKSAIFAPRSYEGRVAEAIVVDGAGWATSNFRRLPYRRVRRPLHPLDATAAYDGAAWLAPRRAYTTGMPAPDAPHP